MFTPFFSSKKKASDEDSGNGLGLYICKRILEVYQGKICAENKKSGGTLVTIYI